MGKRCLLDTNTAIYFLEGVLPAEGKSFVKKAISNGANISVISKIEILAWNPPDISKTENIRILLSDANVYHLDDTVAEHTASLHKKYKKVKLPDAIIAAPALVHRFDLITRNTSDFSIIKELKVIDSL